MKIETALRSFVSKKNGQTYYVCDVYIVFDSGKKHKTSQFFIEKWQYERMKKCE